MGTARDESPAGGDSSSGAYTFSGVIAASAASVSDINVRDRWNTILFKTIASEKDPEERNWLRNWVI